MADDSVASDPRLAQLLATVRITIAFEEAAVAALSDLLTRYEADFPPAEIQRIVTTIRSHRVGLIKQRAVMAAIGLYV